MAGGRAIIALTVVIVRNKSTSRLLEQEGKMNEWSEGARDDCVRLLVLKKIWTDQLARYGVLLCMYKLEYC